MIIGVNGLKSSTMECGAENLLLGFRATSAEIELKITNPYCWSKNVVQPDGAYINARLWI